MSHHFDHPGPQLERALTEEERAELKRLLPAIKEFKNENWLFYYCFKAEVDFIPLVRFGKSLGMDSYSPGCHYCNVSIIRFLFNAFNRKR